MAIKPLVSLFVSKLSVLWPWLQRHFTKVQVAGIALAAMSVFPVVFLSSTPIMLLVSAVLGFWWGFLVTTIGTTIGMLLSFLVGKQMFRDRLHRYTPTQLLIHAQATPRSLQAILEPLPCKAFI